MCACVPADDVRLVRPAICLAHTRLASRMEVRSSLSRTEEHSTTRAEVGGGRKKSLLGEEKKNQACGWGEDDLRRPLRFFSSVSSDSCRVGLCVAAENEAEIGLDVGGGRGGRRGEGGGNALCTTRLVAQIQLSSAVLGRRQCSGEAC